MILQKVLTLLEKEGGVRGREEEGGVVEKRGRELDLDG